MKSIVEALATVIQYSGGSARMHEAAIAALIKSHPDQPTMIAALEGYLARCHAELVFRAESESHLQGGEVARSALLYLAGSQHSDPQK